MKSDIFSFWPAIWPILLGASIGALLGYFGQCTSGACPLTSTWWRGAIYGAVLAFVFAATSRSAGGVREEAKLQSNSENSSVTAKEPQAETQI